MVDGYNKAGPLEARLCYTTVYNSFTNIFWVDAAFP